MLISDKYRFIFIHTYKTAGVSITNAIIAFFECSNIAASSS